MKRVVEVKATDLCSAMGIDTFMVTSNGIEKLPKVDPNNIPVLERKEKEEK